LTFDTFKAKSLHLLGTFVEAALPLTLPFWTGLLLGVFLVGVFLDGVFLPGVPTFLFAGLFNFSVLVPFLKLVERRAVALNLIRTFSDADIGFDAAFVSLAVADLAAVFFLGDVSCWGFALDDVFAVVATLMTFDLLIVFLDFVVGVDLEFFVILVTVMFFLTWTGAFFLLRADFALDTALEKVFFTDLLAITLRFLLSADVDSSRTFPSLRFVPAREFLDFFC
jgi:hypothetical protein